MTLGITADPAVATTGSIDGEDVDEAARMAEVATGQARRWLRDMARGQTVSKRLKTARRVELTLLIMRAGDELESGGFELPALNDAALLDNIHRLEQRMAHEVPSVRFEVYTSMQQADEDLADKVLDRSQWESIRTAFTISSVRSASDGGGA
jgi:hypothetical protein